MSEWLERLTGSANVATVLGSIPASPPIQRNLSAADDAVLYEVQYFQRLRKTNKKILVHLCVWTSVVFVLLTRNSDPTLFRHHIKYVKYFPPKDARSFLVQNHLVNYSLVDKSKPDRFQIPPVLKAQNPDSDPRPLFWRSFLCCKLPARVLALLITKGYGTGVVGSEKHVFIWRKAVPSYM
jgi:hypothetical protein